MRSFRSYGGDARTKNPITFETVSAALSQESAFHALHAVRRKRLVLSLIESRVIYEIYLQDEKAPSSNAAAREIGKIEQSLHRIAKFSERAKDSAPTNDGLRRVISIERGQDRRRIQEFFNMARDVHKVARAAQRAMESEERETPLGEAPISAIEWLVGCRLPGIYADTFKRPFTTTRGSNPGIKFVQKALAAIKVQGSLEDETIISHYKAVQKALG
ncbi:hypothetical protein ACVIIV_005074 [Bradyrhizobium sp. USDA 4354]